MRSAGMTLPGNGSRTHTAVDVAAGRRIVDGDRPPLRVAQVAEVAAQLRFVRHRVGRRVRRLLPIAFIREHEERLVRAVVEAGDLHRAVDLEAVLIELVIRLRLVVHLQEVLGRIERLAAQELVDRAVQIVRAGLQRHVDDAAGGAAVLRVVAVGDDLELLDRVDRRHVGDVVAALNRVVRRAVEQVLVVAVRAAVDRPVGDRAVVERPLIDRRSVVGDARRQVRQHERIARVERQLRHAHVVDDHAAIGLGRFDRFADDRHRLADRSDLHLDRQRDRRADFQLHLFLRVLAEAFELDGECIETWFEEGKIVEAVAARDRGRRFVRRRIHRGDRGAGKRQAAGVGDGACDGTAELLRRGRLDGRGHERHECAYTHGQREP